MDRPSFEEAVQIAERHRAALEAAGSTSAEQIARTHRRPEMFGALIDRSKVSRTYWDAAKLVAYQLRRRGESLPPELNDWAVDAFTGIRPRSVARGRDPYENTQRDWLIYVVVKKLEAVGFHATRNKATGDAKGTACAKGGTACDAVGQAFGLGYKAVEKIWESFRAMEIAGNRYLQAIAASRPYAKR